MFLCFFVLLIIRAFAFLKNVTFILKKFKSLNLNSLLEEFVLYTLSSPLHFWEDKFMEGNEQEGFLVMSCNELVLGDAWRAIASLYHCMKTEPSRVSLTFKHGSLPSQNGQGRDRTHSIYGT